MMIVEGGPLARGDGGDGCMLCTLARLALLDGQALELAKLAL